MNIEEIRKNKPDGATHYGFRENMNVVYFKYIIGVLCKYSIPAKSFYKCYSSINIKPL